MGVGAGLSDGGAEIRPATLGIRQEDRPRAGYRPSFGARIRETIARRLPGNGKPLQKGASRRPFCVSERRLGRLPPGESVILRDATTIPRISMSRTTANPVFDWADPLVVAGM